LPLDFSVDFRLPGPGGQCPFNFEILNRLLAGLKVRGLGGLTPQLLTQPPPQLKGECGGRLREGIRERGKR